MTVTSVRTMTGTDLNEVVKLHQVAFKGFFLEQMGHSFIKAYYKIALAYEGSVAYVYVGKSGFVEGFVVGCIEPAAFYKTFIRSGFQLVFPILSGTIHNPKLLLKIFENIKRVASSGLQDSQFVLDKQTAELSSIAVVTSAKGIGSLLIGAFSEDVWSRGLTNITLTTDYEDNELVNNFYIKHGFTKNGLEVRKGRKLMRYILSKG